MISDPRPFRLSYRSLVSQTAITTDHFTHGDFGLCTGVSIGSRTLATYSYTNDRNHYLSALDYGNGDKVQYTYDNKGRVTGQTYEDGDTVAKGTREPSPCPIYDGLGFRVWWTSDTRQCKIRGVSALSCF